MTSHSRSGLTLSLLLAALVLSACQPGDEPIKDQGTNSGSGTASIQQAAATPGDVTANDLPSLQRQLAQQVGDRVFFETDHWDLSSADQTILRQQAAWLSAHPQLAVTIAGHSDERGTREYNLALGERSATTVQQFLLALGVDPHRLNVISYGKEEPDCTDSGEACWSTNRRAVTLLANQ
jgi:peptidoglycan-associated lipoprotein